MTGRSERAPPGETRHDATEACNAPRMRGLQIYSRGCLVHLSRLCRPYSTRQDEGRVQLPALHVRKFALPSNGRLIGSACSNGAIGRTLLQRSCCSDSGLRHTIRIRLVNFKYNYCR